jgi:hypothetical protein
MGSWMDGNRTIAVDARAEVCFGDMRMRDADWRLGKMQDGV